jgi:ankyrin repeat protein
MSVMDRKLPSPTHGLLWDAVETNDIKAVEQLLEKISSE